LVEEQGCLVVQAEVCPLHFAALFEDIVFRFIDIDFVVICCDFGLHGF